MKRGVVGLIAGVAGLTVTGAAAGAAVHRRRSIAGRSLGREHELGSLRATPLTVVADDGVPLHVEVDEVDEVDRPEQGDGGAAGPVTVVLVHGYALNLDCWHFQRAALRGRLRTVLYDQRSHGRSGRSEPEHATIDQLGSDLARVLEEVTEGPVVLVGHSMGGMTLLALAEQRPELFADRVVGVGLVATAAGGLQPHKSVLPMLPSTIGGELSTRLVALLSRGHHAVDGVRRLGRDVAFVATDMFAFGGPVPETMLAFVDDMLAATPFEVLADFFPSFRRLDKYAALGALEGVPTVVVGATKDRMTPIRLSRRLAEGVPGAELVECEGAGHLVILEQHERVDEALATLVERATELARERAA
ncbi:alpha/beta hydrolase [Nocardioides lentus]|uniref:Alpha/beta hydrolase n=1 Tax=Nocardioides lentus TaxID=338077 RepID=A0ABN2PRS2_9ACTN